LTRDSIPSVLYPDDVEWLLKHCAQYDDTLDPRPTDLVGYGVVNAYATVQKLQYPYILKHFSGPYTGPIVDPNRFDTLSIAFPGWRGDTANYDPAKNGDNTYRVKRYHLTQRVPYGEIIPEVERAWGRGGNDETGYGWPLKLRKAPYRLPLYRVGYCTLAEENAWDSTGCTLETNVYQAWKIDLSNPGAAPDSVGWIPCHPSQVRFTGSVLARIDRHATPVDRTDSPVGISISEPYPNPAVSYAWLHVTISRRTEIVLEMHDVFGRRLVTSATQVLYEPGVHAVRIPVTHPGVVFVRATAIDGTSISKRIVVVR